MRLKVADVIEVAERHLCCGCGACAYVSGGAVGMADVLEQGRRPVVRGVGDEVRMREALAACPGVELGHAGRPDGVMGELWSAWGPVLEVWEGWASDEAVRWAGSSGGAATALALYCMERGGMHGTLHVGARRDVPYLNETVLSRTRAEMLERTGSRYAPASPCDGLGKVEGAPGPCVFIGKPCDVAGSWKARGLRPGLDAKLGLTVAIFCAGTPSTRGTLEMLAAMGVEDASAVTGVRYRGMGWPGKASATWRGGAGGEERRAEMTYAASWGGILEKHRQWRCYVCVDHTGEFADVSVGDPWYREPGEGEAGRSLVLARTERGRRIVREAVAAGYLTLAPAESWKVEASQRGFPTVRGSVWGRTWTCRAAGVLAPRFTGMPMARFWWGRLSLKQKAQSVWGTLKRIRRKGLRVRRGYVAYEPEPGVGAGGAVRGGAEAVGAGEGVR